MSGGRGRIGGRGATRARPPTFGAIVVVGAVLWVAGCGGTDFEHGNAAPPPAGRSTIGLAPMPSRRDAALQAKVVGAVARTRASKRARASISVTFTGLGRETLASGAFDVAGSGVVDLVGGDAALTLSIPIFDRLGGGGTIEQRIVAGVVYTRLPATVLRGARLPATVRWLSLDPRPLGPDRSALSQSQVDPAGQLAFLAVASDDVRFTGSESVRGVPTTRYTVTVDPAQLAAGTQRNAAARAKLRQLGSVLDARPVLVDVWLDAEGRARRVVASFPLSSRVDNPKTAATGPVATMRVQGDFYAFGAPVNVVAPAPGEVRPYSALDGVPISRR